MLLHFLQILGFSMNHLAQLVIRERTSIWLNPIDYLRQHKKTHALLRGSISSSDDNTQSYRPVVTSIVLPSSKVT